MYVDHTSAVPVWPFSATCFVNDRPGPDDRGHGIAHSVARHEDDDRFIPVAVVIEGDAIPIWVLLLIEGQAASSRRRAWHGDRRPHRRQRSDGHADAPKQARSQGQA